MDGSEVSRIEQDLERRRAQIDGTLRAIEDRLSVRAMSDNAWHYVQGSLIGEYGENLRDTVAGNPLPVTLLGVSLAWLMLGGQRASAGRAAGELGEGLGEGAHGLRESGEQLASGTAAAARAAGGAAREAARGAAAGGAALGHSAQSALHQARRAARGYGRMVEHHPLATGIMGLAVGAALAAVLPETEAEDRAMGAARDDFAEQAKAKGEQIVKGAQATAQAGLQAAEQEAQRQTGAGGT